MRWRRKSRDAEPPLVKIRFELEPDDDGWPPVGGESLWAFDLGHDRYRLDNTPWFVRALPATTLSKRARQTLTAFQWSTRCSSTPDT